MSGYVERGVVPGLVTAVQRHGETHFEVIGNQGFGDKAAMPRDTIFRIASMTKPIAAVAAMMLVEECVLRLDDPVDRFLPELANRRVLKHVGAALDETVPASRPIILRDLLTLRLGIGLDPAAWANDHPIQQAMVERGIATGPYLSTVPGSDAWIARLGELPLIHQPGETWMYDIGLDALGVLIERASGQALDGFFEERIFEPLGMKDSGFSVPLDKLDRLGPAYQSDPETHEIELFDSAGPESRWSRPPPFFSARGGLVSTADDYLAFAQMLLNMGRHGNQRLLSRPSVELMTVDQLTPEQKPPDGFILDTNRGWGFGLSVVTRRHDISAIPGRYGWEGGYGTAWANDPSEGVVGIILTQRQFSAEMFPLFQDFWTLVYQALDD
jgi:CubicO group peptidase (beta-lactamase class C family)